MTTKILAECLREALRSLPEHNQFLHHPHTTFVIQDNKIIEWGENRTGDPPVYFGYFKRSEAPKLHAELIAYRRARGILSDGPFDMVNLLFNKQGDVKNAAPCDVCQSWLRAVGCRTVWFSHPAGWGKVIL